MTLAIASPLTWSAEDAVLVDVVAIERKLARLEGLIAHPKNVAALRGRTR